MPSFPKVLISDSTGQIAGKTVEFLLPNKEVEIAAAAAARKRRLLSQRKESPRRSLDFDEFAY